MIVHLCSEVFKGLVFKKHAALKHMATKYDHPKIMLIEGVLGQPLSGLSSFQSMDQVRRLEQRKFGIHQFESFSFGNVLDFIVANRT